LYIKDPATTQNVLTINFKATLTGDCPDRYVYGVHFWSDDIREAALQDDTTTMPKPADLTRFLICSARAVFPSSVFGTEQRMWATLV
jgi:hypothetical protein